ncbi:hypothetical protein D3C84_149380 [compost metagenome]
MVRKAHIFHYVLPAVLEWVSPRPNPPIGDSWHGLRMAEYATVRLVQHTSWLALVARTVCGLTQSQMIGASGEALRRVIAGCGEEWQRRIRISDAESD